MIHNVFSISDFWVTQDAAEIEPSLYQLLETGQAAKFVRLIYSVPLLMRSSLSSV